MVTRFSSTVLAFLILQTSLFAADQPDYVFLMIGQSNMAGRAKMLDEDKKPLAGGSVVKCGFEMGTSC